MSVPLAALLADPAGESPRAFVERLRLPGPGSQPG
jgi:hypothetical protein